MPGQSRTIRLHVEFALEDPAKLLAAVREAQYQHFGIARRPATAGEALYELFVMTAAVDTARAGIRLLWNLPGARDVEFPSRRRRNPMNNPAEEEDGEKAR